MPVAPYRRPGSATGPPHSDAGSVTVELAAAIPLLVAVTLAMVSLLGLARDQVLAQGAAREAAREAAIGGDDARASAAARAALPPGRAARSRSWPPAHTESKSRWSCLSVCPSAYVPSRSGRPRSPPASPALLRSLRTSEPRSSSGGAQHDGRRRAGRGDPGYADLHHSGAWTGPTRGGRQRTGPTCGSRHRSDLGRTGWRDPGESGADRAHPDGWDRRHRRRGVGRCEGGGADRGRHGGIGGADSSSWLGCRPGRGLGCVPGGRDRRGQRGGAGEV